MTVASLTRPRWLRRRPRAAVARVRTPTILQMEAVECGAAALAMVLGHHGCFVPLEELRVACGVSRDGSKASNLIRAAKRYGLDARGFKKEPEALRTLPVPMIVHWNFNHFLVVEGITDEAVYLNDPAAGPTTVSPAQFDQSFTGVVLTFARGERSIARGTAPSLMHSLRARLPGIESALLFVVLAGLALVIPGLVVPAFSRIFVDDVLVRGMHEWIRPTLVLMVATGLIVGVLTWLQQWYLLRLESKLSVTMSAGFFWHVLRLPLSFFSQRSAGDIGVRVGINDRVARVLSGDLATTALGVLLVTMYGVLLFAYDRVLALVAVLIVAINAVVLRHVSRTRADLSRRLLQDRGRLMGTAMGGLMTIETLKATGAESDFFSRWAGYNAKVTNGDQELQRVTRMVSLIPPALMSLNAAAVLGLGGARVMNGDMSIGLLIAFQALMALFLAPIGRLVEISGAAQEVRGDLARLDDVLRAEPDPLATVAHTTGPAIDLPDSPPLPVRRKLRGALSIQDLSFGFSPLDPPLLEHFSLDVAPGRRVALVGGSGSGKSTVAKLVAGLHVPWSGQVLFDGAPREAHDPAVLQASIGFVDQDIAMFEDTIRNNITLWDATPAESEVLRAAMDAEIHDDIMSRNGGYSGSLGEGGNNFSGGQRQRLEIARALLHHPTLLVLDEATSALDPVTEQLIDDHVRQRGCTCLIVAHRLSTIRDCDEILVMERGRVVQRGTHDALSAVDGPYQSLLAAE
jgi:NHLM bacteriocin system ABC transporter peptidase/ATP-binding protein